MDKIAIVTDSTCDLKSEVLKELGVRMVPLKVTLNEKDYYDKVDISSSKFMDLLDGIDVLPTTSQPAVGDFVATYEDLADDYDVIFSLHISEEMSGTLKSANLAAQMVDDVEVKVVDSRLVTAPLGVMVSELAKAANKNKSVGEISALIKELRKNINIYFTVDELDYLEKGGRIGKAAAFLGGIFNVKPILSIEDGVIVPYKKVRGEKRLFKTFKELVENNLENGQGQRLVVLYGKYEAQANKLKDLMTEEFEWGEVEMIQLGPVVGAHVGPTPFGVVILK